MVRENILGKLKLALTKGESLKQAVLNLYKRGYKKEEIEEATKELHLQISQQKLKPIINLKIKEDILGGLKLAVSKGESLKKAMISFYNANYKKENIEAAARSLLQTQRTQQIQPFQQRKPVKTIQQPRPIQKVSSYGQKPNQIKAKLVLFFFIFILLILLGGLISVFAFKPDVMNFLSGFFV